MSWTLQLVRSTPLENLEEIHQLIRTAMGKFCQDGTALIVDVSDGLLRCVKMQMSYESGFIAESMMAGLMRLMEDGEWMLFVETRDSDVFGDPVRLLGITHGGFANVESMDLVRMVISPMVDILEENPVDTDASRGRTVDAEGVSGSTDGDG